jgi:hypothetical protein
MSNWSTIAARVNAAQLRAFGSDHTLQMEGAPPAVFKAIPGVRPPESHDSAAAFESLWTTSVSLPVTPSLGATVLIGTVECLVHDVKQDEDRESNGFTIHLNRKRPL